MSIANDVQLFYSEEFNTLRVITDENKEPWINAQDVCRALGISEARQSTRYLDEDEKGVFTTHTPGGDQRVTYVSEPGFYRLVMKSRKPEAKAFQRWVTHDVLPSIRRDGAYVYSDGTEDEDELIARALKAANRKIERQRAQIDELKPKALFADAVAASDGTCLVGELAKMLRQNGVEIGQNRLFEWMRDGGYLGKSGSNKNVPTQRAMDMGLFRIKETAVTHSDGHVTINRTPKVTGKGQRYFVEKLMAVS